jgi:hypothetical protein
MKNLVQLQLELSKNEQLTQADLTTIMGGWKRNKKKARRNVEYMAVATIYSFERVAPEATDDDKRRPRPGGGSTTTSPSIF